MTIPDQPLRAVAIALLVPILWVGCRKSEGIRDTGSPPGVDSAIAALFSDSRHPPLMSIPRGSGLPQWSVMGGEDLYIGIPGRFESGEIQDTTPSRTFAIVDSTRSWGMVQLQWGLRHRDLVLESRNRLVFDGRWDGDTFVASLRKGERTKGQSVPPGCMCKAIPPRDFFVRLSFEDRPRIWLRLVRKGGPSMLIRWDSSGARVVGADSVTAIPVSTYKGSSYVFKCLLFCRGEFLCHLP